MSICACVSRAPLVFRRAQLMRLPPQAMIRAHHAVRRGTDARDGWVRTQYDQTSVLRWSCSVSRGLLTDAMFYFSPPWHNLWFPCCLLGQTKWST